MGCLRCSAIVCARRNPPSNKCFLAGESSWHGYAGGTPAALGPRWAVRNSPLMHESYRSFSNMWGVSALYLCRYLQKPAERRSVKPAERRSVMQPRRSGPLDRSVLCLFQGQPQVLAPCSTCRPSRFICGFRRDEASRRGQEKLRRAGLITRIEREEQR